MIPRKSLKILLAVSLLPLFLVNPPLGLGDQGEITSVQVAPDLSHVSIHSNGPLGKHSAFVIDRPYRLVIDFESTAIGNTKSKVRIDKGMLIEIRLGYNKGRARVVIDFGEHPVPPFHIDRNGDAFVVALGQTPPIQEERVTARPEPNAKKQSQQKPPEKPTAAVQTQSKPIAPQPMPAPDSKPVSLSKFQQHGDDSTVVIKDAGIKSNLVFVELVHKDDPRISYRLIVDLDIEELNIRSASMSDAKGNLKKFQISRTETEKLTQSRQESPVIAGPRRHLTTGPRTPLEASPRIASQPKLSTNSQQSSAQNAAGGWPLKIEQFQPQPKTAVR